MFSPMFLYSSVVTNDTEASQQEQFFITICTCTPCDKSGLELTMYMMIVKESLHFFRDSVGSFVYWNPFYSINLLTHWSLGEEKVIRK